MYKKINMIGFIILFLTSVCILPASQGSLVERENLRSAVVLAKELSSQVEMKSSGFTDAFVATVKILRSLSSLEVTLKKGNAGDDKSRNTIVLSSRLSYLINCPNQFIYNLFSYNVDYIDKSVIYISILSSPDVPPPNVS